MRTCDDCIREREGFDRENREYHECDRCKQAKAQVNTTWRNYQEAERAIASLPAEINALGAEIADQQAKLQREVDKENGLRADKDTAWNTYEPKKAKCDKECNECKVTRGPFKTAIDNLKSTDARIENLNSLIPQERTRIDNERNLLAQDEAQEKGLRTAKADADDALAPVEVRCAEDLQQQYDDKKSLWMRTNISTLYDKSCEKACMQASKGCGVIEGLVQGEVWKQQEVASSPGIDIKCSPPFESFISKPVKWGAPQESEDAACDRLFEKQRPARANQVLMKGWLVKRGGMFRRWKKRYFVLESGDQVRSAILRYWADMPGPHKDAERVDKPVVLWDAASVKPEPGTKYGWKDGTACFFLQHFYRDFRLCVRGEPNNVALRDQWVNHLKNSIKFPSVAPPKEKNVFKRIFKWWR